MKFIFGAFAIASAFAANAQSASVPLIRPIFPGQLNQGKVMVPEETINSPSGTYSLRFNSDGSLGLYQNSNNSRVWIAKGDSGTSFGDTVSFLQDTPQYGKKWTQCFGMGKNGSYVNKLFKSCQTSSVRGLAGGEAYLAVQDDGNLVVYAMSQAWKADGKYINGYEGIAFPMGTTFSKGSSFSTSNGAARLDFSTTGNLEVYTNGALTWQSGTGGSGESAVMQGDGNFVIYNAAGNAIWNTNTSGRKDAYLALASNGALNVIARVEGSQGVLWHR
ncbi:MULTISPECIES: hypothetical protein [Xanthomonas]|uniref:Bulb-type lectin domain-containing protein n=1 Tax=Xanthomonas rydalmerensis TaxID=3046274 RepID=A0ABZ0JK19_9XANT|nr:MULTISPECIES: hypothetical protein [unclassified Xanthomonas]WOS40127.1 hypothetical protein QN243_17250 [Xanthomonas sp. DM-2023]WOS44311.1 hypothetical protein QN242_17250 [Xanthomonas sp. DM-2023]WOS48491.1 hypothetical protein QN240_17250 [Xanthomonas sp. DM-2023]WOS52671.1 hypothetical protein QN244_17255 [Xanthomonas sp. DM-2023]WOS56855.1 hypothetical protein QN245_17250 [Xanthomonas sp. DM-2023]